MTSFPEGPGRNKALAFWGGIGGLGATAALLIGGALTDAIGWRSIFLPNLPVAAAMLALAPVLLCESRDRARGRHLDVTGALTVTGALALLVVAFVRVPDVGWTGPSTIATLLVAAGLGVAFVAAERRSVAPLVPLRVFGSRSLVAGNLVMLLAAMTAVGMSLTRSLYAQDLLGYSPLKFGLAATAMTTMTLVGSFAAEALVGRLGLWPIAAASMICLGAGSLALTQISPTAATSVTSSPDCCSSDPVWAPPR